MSNMLAVLNTNQLPAHLAQFATQLPEIKLGGGSDTRNKITMKNGRFVLHIAGSQEKVLDVLKLPVIIVGAHDNVSRMFYAQKYQPGVKARPSCFSSDGLTPAVGAPNKQSARCDICPKNQKGSGENGGKACSFFKRLVVLIAGKATPFMLDVKGMSIFGTGDTANGNYSLTEYSKVLAGKGINPSMVVTELSFDTSSTVAKIFFTPKSFIDENMAAQVQAILSDKEVIESYRAVELDTLGDAPDNTATAPAANMTNFASAPAPQAAPAQAAPVPVQQAAPQPATTPAPTVQKFNLAPDDKPVDVPVSAHAPAAANVTSNEVDSLLDGISFD